VPRVSVTVNGRSYEVACEEGQEGHVTYLAEFLDKRVSEIAGDIGQVGEARLLLMAGLLTSDDLANAYDEIERLRGALEEASAGGGEVAKAAETILSETAGRIEHIAAKLENT
jgi:cell division protein ZapA